MFPQRITQSLTRAGTSLRQHPTRCLRRRFKKNRCRECLESCPSGAISLEGSNVVIDQSRCTECLRCADACPSEAIAPKHSDFFKILEEIDSLPHPTVACRRKEKLAGNAFFSCAGIFGYEHLLALALLLPEPVQINLTACRQCSSGGMLSALQQIHRDLERHIPLYRGRVRLIEEEKELNFRPRDLGRRDLFALWGRSARDETVRFIRHLESDGGSGDLGEKRLPVKRRLLNRILQERPDAAKELKAFFYHHLRATDRCNGCRICVSMCPTGALTRGENRTLLFRSELCTACGLCMEFCPPGAISLHTGCPSDPAVPTVIFPRST